MKNHRPKIKDQTFRWPYAYRLCEFAKQDEMWRELGRALLRNNEVPMGEYDHL